MNQIKAMLNYGKIMPEFIGDTWYSVGLDEWDDIVFVTHKPDFGDEFVELESWLYLL